MTKAKKLHALSGVIAFIATIFGWFSINSYVADKYDLNWLAYTIGIVGTLGAIYVMYRAQKATGSGDRFNADTRR
jgi:predicted membrane protein